MTRSPSSAPTGHRRSLWLGTTAALLCAALACATALRLVPGKTTSTRELRPSAIQVMPGSFAFLRGGQVYLGRAKSLERRLTSFAAPDPDPTHTGPLVWSPDNRHLAVAIGAPVVAQDTAATATGTLYIVDTSTGATVTVAPTSAAQPGIAVGPAAYAWADAHTLLYAANGQLFSYALATDAATPVPGITGLVIDLEVRGHTLYYMSYQTDGPLFTLPVGLRRHDLVTHADTPLADLGQAEFETTGCNTVGCEPAAGVPILAPAWDVSDDGTQLAYERITAFAPDLSSATVAFWYEALAPAATGAAAPASAAAAQPIFAGVPTTLPAETIGACCYLRFAPDGRGLVLSSGAAMSTTPTPFGPYLTYTYALAKGYQSDALWAFGPAAWAPDAASFTLVVHYRGAKTTDLLTYANQQTTILQSDAYDGAWAYTTPV